MEDLHFLGVCVARQFDFLQAIEEGFRDRACGVGGADEQHVRQVDGHVDVVVHETAVLGGVQDL